MCVKWEHFQFSWQLQSFQKEKQHFWSCLSFRAECIPVNLGLLTKLSSLYVGLSDPGAPGKIKVVFLFEKSLHWMLLHVSLKTHLGDYDCSILINTWSWLIIVDHFFLLVQADHLSMWIFLWSLWNSLSYPLHALLRQTNWMRFYVLMSFSIYHRDYYSMPNEFPSNSAIAEYS